MKYVLTKQGKIMTTAEWLRLLEESERYFMEMDDMIVKQADTIEELCDEFVLFKDGKPYALVSNDENNLKMVRGGAWGDLRGAIWTDLGLIYVAKMNEKGEWELL